MTATEIRANMPPMVIWMADITIREARKGITKKTGWNDVKRADYNLPEVEMAGEVLFRMFNACAADIRFALLGMPEELDGIFTVPGKNYFDEFVENLDRRLRKFASEYPECIKGDPAWPREAEPRRSNWILEKC